MDQYHGTGVLITLEGTYYEGTFDKGKLLVRRKKTREIFYQLSFLSILL